MVTQGLREGPRWCEEVSIGSYLGSVMRIPTITLSGTAVLANVANIQAGTVGSRTGSDATVTFYQAFTSAPIVFVQNSTVGTALTTTPIVPIGSISTTSFYTMTTGSPSNFNWLAIGPM